MKVAIINKSYLAYAYYQAKGDNVLFETKEQQKKVLGAYRSLERNNNVKENILQKAFPIYLKILDEGFEQYIKSVQFKA